MCNSPSVLKLFHLIALDHFGSQIDFIEIKSLDDFQPIYYKPLFWSQLDVGENKSRWDMKEASFLFYEKW